jgi:fatty acid-binding protein DegV
LFKGGRCSSLAYFGSNLLKIKPQIVMTDGQMHSAKKFMGSNDGAYMKYVNATLEEFNTPDLDIAFITYTTCKDEIVEEVKKALINRGFKNVYVTHAGATITSYCGQGCLGILYLNDGK